jgi:RND family efflux transporter MFP subunit
MKTAVALLVPLIATSAALAQAPKGKAGAPPAPKVLVTPARADTIAEPRVFVGTVKPIRHSLVGSAAAGRVEEYLINEGDAVTAGQPIAVLRRGIIKAEVDAARATLTMRQAELSEMEKSYQDEVEQEQAKVSTAQADLAFRQGKAIRTRSLGTSAAKELYEEDYAAAQKADAAVHEHQAALRMLTQGPRQMKTEQARARVTGAQAELSRLEEQFDRHTMKAPFDGWISAEHTEVGQWVMQGDPVAEVVELNAVDIEIPVVEDFIGNLHTAVEGMVDIPALGQQRFVGRVAIINPQADARAHTFPVKIRVANKIENNQPLLKAGMFARVTLAVGKPTPCVLVPKDAVVLGGPQPLVFVAASAGDKTTVRPVPVTLGQAQGSWIAAIGEMKEGDQVIVEGNERVRPGQEIRPEAKEVAYP